MTYTARGKEIPEDFDAEIFLHIYEALRLFREDKNRQWSAIEVTTFWAPIIAALRELRGLPVPVQAPGGDIINVDIIDVDADVEMEGDEGASVYELSSEAGSEEQ